MNCDRLQRFRQDTYQLLGKAHDATFELMDSIMTTKNVYCLGEFSLSPLFRRKWSSVYEALQDCRPNRNQLMKRYLQEIPRQEYVLLGIDHTAWGRNKAKTLKERTYAYQSSANGSVTLGQGYSTIAWLPEAGGSWTLPLRQERITSFETPITKAAWQLKQVCQHLNQKVLVVADREYGNGSWVQQTANINASLLLRVRANACFWSKPPAYSGKGRPRQHGTKFQVNNPKTWGEAAETVEITDPKLGQLKLTQWRDLHFRTAPERSLNLIQVARLTPNCTEKQSTPLWLVWIGEEFCPLAEVWSQYARRFGVDHWYRFAKQRLHWRATPRRKTAPGNARAGLYRT